MTSTTTATDHGDWQANGWLVERRALGDDLVAAVEAAVDEVAGWAERARRGEPAPGMHHWEQTDAGAALARSEDLLDQPTLRDLIVGEQLLASASSLLGEQAVLFKEKINYKHPGGAGFAPHQDASAYRFSDHHVSCMVPLDPATTESGCLWVVAGQHQGLLASTPGGRVDPEVAATLTWEPAEVAPGDLLWFDSYTPHRSDTNRSERARRALYLTYNAARDGDLRARYYDDKRAEFTAGDGLAADGRVRVSITDDYLGRPVEDA